MSAPLSPERRAAALLAKAQDVDELCSFGQSSIRVALGLYGEETLAALVSGVRTDVPALLAEVERLRIEHDRDLGSVIDERDRMHDVADRLAYAVAPIEVIGEHSSDNDPWENALDLITPRAEVERLTARVAELEAVAPRCSAVNPYQRACGLAVGHQGNHVCDDRFVGRTEWPGDPR